MQKKKLSLEPYKGTRDFYPQDQFVQDYIFSLWRKAAQSYGYLEYGASILEETELYRAKSGEEIVSEQTYSFKDRGDRDVTIRPEMTPTVARMVAQKRRELNFPLRWFSIPNLFRYERPQRGRLREHWQLNVDMFGVDSMDCDVEVICLAYDTMKAFGAKDGDFEIRLNNRRLINHLLKEYLDLDQDSANKVSRLIDKMHKMKDAEFIAAATALVADKASLLMEVLYIKSLEELGAKTGMSQGAKELGEVLAKLKSRGLTNVVFDPTLVRGFDYYTGTVFEMFDTNPVNPRALFGGGRYDDLVGIFGVEKVSGVGFGWGDVTTRDFLETHGLLPEYKSPVKLYIAHLDGYIEQADSLARYIRSQGISAEVDLTGRQVPKQIKTADKEKIPFVVVVGEEEVKNGKYKVKNLASSQETEVSKEEIVAMLK